MSKTVKRILVGVLICASGLWQVSPTYAAKAKIYNLNITSNQKTIKVHVGDFLNLKLESTYWNIEPLTSQKISQLSDPVITPIMPGPSAPAGCQLPGSGCGTIIWKLKALKKGSAQIKANRTSCGEALKCSPEDAIYIVQVKII